MAETTNDTIEAMKKAIAEAIAENKNDASKVQPHHHQREDNEQPDPNKKRKFTIVKSVRNSARREHHANNNAKLAEQIANERVDIENFYDKASSFIGGEGSKAVQLYKDKFKKGDYQGLTQNYISDLSSVGSKFFFRNEDNLALLPTSQKAIVLEFMQAKDKETQRKYARKVFNLLKDAIELKEAQKIKELKRGGSAFEGESQYANTQEKSEALYNKYANSLPKEREYIIRKMKRMQLKGAY